MHETRLPMEPSAPAAEVLYREGGEADLEIAMQMRARMTEELSGRNLDIVDPPWRLRFRDFYAARLSRGSVAIFLAEARDRAVGMAAAYLLSNHRSEIFAQPSAYVTNVYVEPEWRRKGIATALMRLVVDWARRQGCVVVRLRPSEPGRGLYAALGFRESGEMEFLLHA